jgi:hypothetical protein
MQLLVVYERPKYTIVQNVDYAKIVHAELLSLRKRSRQKKHLGAKRYSS